MSTRSSNSLFNALLVLAIGGLAYVYWFNPASINPLNLGFVEKGDPSMFQAGWEQFRARPWSWPLGVIAGYGSGTSIVYTDSIPLLALLLKPLHTLLPDQFQYFGLWALISYMLLALFAQRTLALVVEDRLQQLLGTAFFLAIPFVIWRVTGHIAVGSVWIVVAGIYLSFSSSKTALTHDMKWAALIGVAALVHAYLLAMLLALFVAHVTQRWLVSRWSVNEARESLQTQLRRPLLAFALMVVTMVAAGYFLPGGKSTAAGFGNFSLNLLAPFYNHGNSALLPDRALPFWPQFEGIAYPGLGVFLLIAIAVVATALSRKRGVLHEMLGGVFIRRFGPIVLVCILMAVFALSNQVTLGSKLLFTIPLPETLYKFASVFRASGRFVWPLGLVSLFALIVMVNRAFTPSAARATLLVCLALQFIDLRQLHMRLQENHVHQPVATMNGKHAAAIANRYREIKFVSPTELNSSTISPLRPLLRAAASSAVAVNAIAGARVSERDTNEELSRVKQLLNGALPKNTAFLFMKDAGVLEYSQHLQAGNSHAIYKLGESSLLLPYWFESRSQHSDASSFLPATFESAYQFSEIPLNKSLYFGANAEGLPFLGTGWSIPEPNGIWSLGKVSRLVLQVPSACAAGCNAKLTLHAFTPQTVRVMSNQKMITQWVIAGDYKPAEFVLNLDAERVKQNNKLLLELYISNPTKPAAVGLGGDQRELGVMLSALRVDL
jgi:hypothetical protein